MKTDFIGTVTAGDGADNYVLLNTTKKVFGFHIGQGDNTAIVEIDLSDEEVKVFEQVFERIYKKPEAQLI